MILSAALRKSTQSTVYGIENQNWFSYELTFQKLEINTCIALDKPVV